MIKKTYQMVVGIETSSLWGDIGAAINGVANKQGFSKDLTLFEGLGNEVEYLGHGEMMRSSSEPGVRYLTVLCNFTHKKRAQKFEDKIKRLVSKYECKIVGG